MLMGECTIMSKKNILFSDANHGGLVLLEEYSKYTQNNLFFYDIYDKLSDDEKENISRKFNVTFLSLEEIITDEDSFVKVNPVHMPPVICTDFTHHEFVSYLLSKRGIDFKLIQVTGVKGKTTVTSFLRDIFSSHNTLVLTSDRLTFNNSTLVENLSITPASIITAVNLAEEENVLDSVEYAIFEVSLGVVPNGYISVLTNILEDYPIAGKSSHASAAKSSVFSPGHVICDYDSFKEYYCDEEDVVTLSYDNNKADIFASDVKYGLENTSFSINYLGKKYDITHFALSDFYVNNLMFAISVALMAHIHINKILSGLSSANTISGRNSFKYIKDKVVIEDVNPGLNTTSIKKCVDNLSKFSNEFIVIVGGDYGITCEEIDEEKLAKYLGNVDKNKIVLCGKLGESLLARLNDDYSYFKELGQAIHFCLNESDKKIVEVIYRSEYNSNMSLSKLS